MNLAICDGGNTLLIPDQELGELKKSVEAVFNRPRRNVTSASESPSSMEHEGYAGRDDGRVVVEVLQEQLPEGGPRRSTRRRNAIVYDS